MNKYDRFETFLIKTKRQKLLEDKEELILKSDGEMNIPDARRSHSTKKAWGKLIGNYKKRVKVSPPVKSIVKILEDQPIQGSAQILAVIS